MDILFFKIPFSFCTCSNSLPFLQISFSSLGGLASLRLNTELLLLKQEEIRGQNKSKDLVKGLVNKRCKRKSMGFIGSFYIYFSPAIISYFCTVHLHSSYAAAFLWLMGNLNNSACNFYFLLTFFP